MVPVKPFFLLLKEAKQCVTLAFENRSPSDCMQMILAWSQMLNYIE